MIPSLPWTRRRAAEAEAAGGGRADAAGLAAVAAGDGRALEALYRRESGPVYRYALALCGNPAWAADATQDAFVALATRPGGFDAGRAGGLGAYLAGIARHALLARWRDAGQLAPLQEEDAADDHGAESAASPEALLVRTQDGDAVWRALRALEPAFREAVVLVDLQERPYVEAARIAGVEINTLKTRLHRARRKLAAHLGGNDG